MDFIWPYRGSCLLVAIKSHRTVLLSRSRTFLTRPGMIFLPLMQSNAFKTLVKQLALSDLINTESSTCRSHANMLLSTFKKKKICQDACMCSQQNTLRTHSLHLKAIFHCATGRSADASLIFHNTLTEDSHRATRCREIRSCFFYRCRLIKNY